MKILILLVAYFTSSLVIAKDSQPKRALATEEVCSKIIKLNSYYNFSKEVIEVVLENNKEFQVYGLGEASIIQTAFLANLPLCGADNNDNRKLYVKR